MPGWSGASTIGLQYRAKDPGSTEGKLYKPVLRLCDAL
jgi:hypothetical protein